MLAKWAATLRRLHWTRGLRAGIAVLAAMAVCRYLGKPMGWAALGGFEAILVDNGGPYRSRLTTILTVLTGGAIAGVAGALSTVPLWLAVIVTAVFCFAVTYARVLSNPLASSSVIILVIYFAGFGGVTHTLTGALENALAFVFGGLWAAALSLFLWPVDPFRPARQAVAECYAMLAEFTAGVHNTAPDSAERQAERHRMHELQRHMRLKMEAARAAIGTTGARITARTVRARSLTVLLETADILFAGTIRWTELFEAAVEIESQAAIADALGWLSRAEQVIADALRACPQDGGTSFASEGSHSLEHLRKREVALEALQVAPGSLIAHLAHDERDTLMNIEVAFEAVRALWSGVEYRTSRSGSVRAARRSLLVRQGEAQMPVSGWSRMLDAARANWTMRSIMMRHAMRMMVVGGVDVLLMHMVHLQHGVWLAMTSIIVLQPSGSGTLRRGVQRVSGTIAGGVLAAIFAAAVHSETGLIAVITVTSILTLATYAIDYAWYCFFLTPTFVLLALPHLRDWHFAGVRIGTTLLGAIVAVVAMRLLSPERERLQLGRLLARGAQADAGYVRAMIRYWQTLDADHSDASHVAADRQVLAPARRACGLAINDAEEMLDRLMLEPRMAFKPGARWEEALTIVTYLRRMTRAVTTLAVVGSQSAAIVERLEAVAKRLDALGGALSGEAKLNVTPSKMSDTLSDADVAEQQMRRLERQVGVLERTATQLAAG